MWSNIILTQKYGEDGEPDVSNHPPTRYKHSGVLVPSSFSSSTSSNPNSNSNYDLYIFGGRSGTFPLKDFWRLDLKTGLWEEISAPSSQDLEDEWPPHLQEHSMVHYSGKIYIFGGEISLSYGEDLSPLWIFDIAERKWRRWGVGSGHGHEKGQGQGHGAGKGIKSSKSCADLTKTPLGRRGHTATVWNNYMLIYGGYRDLKGSLGDLWAFHFDTESWHLFSSHDLYRKQNARPWYMFGTQAPFPLPRHSHVAVLHGTDSLFVHGGMQDLIELGDLWKFDLKARSWMQVKTKYGPGPIHGHVGLMALESLLILSGERAGKAVDEFWRFDLYSETWERIVLNGCRPCPRVWAWGAILPVVYKRVRVDPSGKQGQVSPGSADENKYWWDYDESIVAHPEDDEEEDVGGKGNVASSGGESSRRVSTSLFSDFARFAYPGGEYHPLSESNSVCLSEEEASPRPVKIGEMKEKEKCQNGTGGRSLEIPGLKKIEEQEPVALIDLGEESTTTETSPPTSGIGQSCSSSSSQETSPEGDLPPSALSKPISSTANTAKRSESATCLQLKKSSSVYVKKSASVRFADMLDPPPSNSSSSQNFVTRGGECTSDYSSMEHGLNLGKTGFENPNYHGSMSSGTFKIVESYEMGEFGGAAEPPAATAPTLRTDDPPTTYCYQVATPNYMLLIGGNESHSSQVVSKRQPLAIWRLRVTRELFASSQSPGDFSYVSLNSANGNGNNGGSGSRPSSGSYRGRLTTTGF